MYICKHVSMGPWSMNRVTRVWRRDCMNCGYYEIHQG